MKSYCGGLEESMEVDTTYIQDLPRGQSLDTSLRCLQG